MLASSARAMALSHRSFYLALALLLQPCIGPCEEWNALDINSRADINRTPLVSNTFNMKWSVANFRPRDLETREKLPFEKGDRRIVFRGKGKDMNNFAILGGVCGRGPFSLGSTISLDDSKGLRDGFTSSWVYADYHIGQDIISHQVNLQYHAALSDIDGTKPGWIARAFIDGVKQGEVEYPGKSSIDVRLVQYDDRLEFLSRPSLSLPYGGGSKEGGGMTFDLLAQSLHAPPDKFEIGLGAFGLDKGGEVYTDMLWLLGPQLGPEVGSDEFFVFGLFSDIGGCLDDGKSSISGSSVSLFDVEDARDQVNAALSSAMSAMFTLKDGLKNDSFDEKAAAKTASKIGKQTYKKLHKISNQLQSMLDKGKVNDSQLKSICNSLEMLIDRSVVGRANMLGVNAKNPKQLDIGYPIPPSEIPDIFGF